ncbi:MAG: hypothetical protein IKD78_06320 [Bacteroidales bacterium]|nr:hypothetical protein [Bacteroidales bacterium]
MADISTNKVGFKNLEWTLSALPILPYLKLEGFGPQGFQWDRPQPASTRLGADGKAVVNQRPVLYSGTLNLLPTSNSRLALDNLINATTAKYGKALVDYAVILTVSNYTTGTKTLYTGGTIEEVDAGDSGTLDDGQTDKQYRFTFTDRVVLPL